MPLVVVATAAGGPEVLELVDEPVVRPGPGQVLLEVRAAGVNPVDIKLYGGKYGSRPPQFPLRLGSEAAGVVRAVGAGAVGAAGQVSVGDEVIAFRVGGAYAQMLVVPGSALVPKPPTLGWEQAAGLMLTGATAVHALAETGVGPRDTVLVHAAAGGVGLMVVQLAVLRGARVIGTASEANHELLRELGAQPVTYGEGLVARVRALAPDGVDAAIDAAGSDEALDVSLELIPDRARIAELVVTARSAAAGVKLLGGSPGADPGTAIRDAARLELVQLVRDGGLRVLLADTYPLADVADAHRAILAGHTVGKIVLVP